MATVGSRRGGDDDLSVDSRDNDLRQRQTQRDTLRHRNTFDLR